MNSTLQDIMGMIAKRKIKVPTDKDYIVSAAFVDVHEVLKPQPKMEANLINIGALKKYIGTGTQGPTGATGATGPAGPTPWNLPATVYDNGLDYNYGDAVIYEGGYYYRTGNPLNPGYPPTPGLINASWTPVADRGEQGIQGIQGIQGTAGSSVTILGSYTDLAAFNAGAGSLPGANIGDAWILLSDGSLMSWNGTVWFDAGDIQGPQGIEGPQGIQGIQGIQGVQGIQGIPGAAGGFGYLGSFYDTTNQTGIAGAVLTMGLNNSDPWNNGVSIVSGNRITIVNPGVYNLAFSAQMIKNSGNTATHAHIWLSQNGTDVPTSASQLGFPSNSIYVVAAWNFFVKTTSANEYVQLKWEINSNVDNGVVITSQTATGNIPAIPGLIVTVNQIG